MSGHVNGMPFHAKRHPIYCGKSAHPKPLARYGVVWSFGSGGGSGWGKIWSAPSIIG